MRALLAVHLFLILLVSSCSIVWGDYTCWRCGNTYDHYNTVTGCAVNHGANDCCHLDEKLIKEGEPFNKPFTEIDYSGICAIDHHKKYTDVKFVYLMEEIDQLKGYIQTLQTSVETLQDTRIAEQETRIAELEKGEDEVIFESTGESLKEQCVFCRINDIEVGNEWTCDNCQKLLELGMLRPVVDD